jgi:hypothetical protein
MLNKYIKKYLDNNIKDQLKNVTEVTIPHDIIIKGKKFILNTQFNNKTLSHAGINTMYIGVNSTNKPVKSLIYHELKHTIKNIIDFEIYDFYDEKRDYTYAARIIVKNTTGPTRISEWLDNNRYSTNFKKTIVFLYLCNGDEMEAILHEHKVLIENMNKKEYFDYLKTNMYVNFYKEMATLKKEVIYSSEKELKNEYLFINTKQMNRMFIDITTVGKKFMKNIHKLSYFIKD